MCEDGRCDQADLNTSIAYCEHLDAAPCALNRCRQTRACSGGPGACGAEGPYGQLGARVRCSTNWTGPSRRRMRMTSNG